MHRIRFRLPARLLSLVSAALLLWAVVGCAGSQQPTATATAPQQIAPPTGTSLTGAGLHGRAQAGPQAIIGARIYLLAANGAGYGTPSLSVLRPQLPGVATDQLGTYVVTDAQGSFGLPAYTCTPGQLVYVLAMGGSAGGEAASNPALAMLTVLGACPSEGNFSQVRPFIDINQVSTVVTAYALSGFLADAAHLGFAPTPGSQTGISNAFAVVANLLNPSTGAAYPQTPNSSGVVPQAEINTLANILVPCTAASSACPSLFTLTHGLDGSVPTDTVQAMLNLARNPGANVAPLFALGANNTFKPALAAAPNDWTLAVTYFAENLAGPYFPAVDAQGNLWVPGFANNTIAEFDPTGVLLSGANGYTGGGLAQPFAIAFDVAGTAYVSNFGASAPATHSISGFAPNGSPITPTGFACGGSCTFLAVDASQNIWVSGSPQVTTLKNSGLPLSAFSTNGFTAGLAIDSQGRGWTIGSGRTLSRLTLPAAVTPYPESVTAPSGHDLTALAIDSADNVWFASTANNALGKHANDGSPLSPSGGYTGGGLHSPAGIAVDGSNRLWAANRDGNSISAFTSAGAALSPATGYTAAGISNPRGLAIDPSGNVWITDFTGNAVTEFIGVATPTATPITPLNHGQRP